MLELQGHQAHSHGHSLVEAARQFAVGRAFVPPRFPRGGRALALGGLCVLQFVVLQGCAASGKDGVRRERVNSQAARGASTAPRARTFPPVPAGLDMESEYGELSDDPGSSEPQGRRGEGSADQAEQDPKRAAQEPGKNPSPQDPASRPFGEGNLGPDILLPPSVTDPDTPVATVAGHVLRKSHVYDRMLVADQELALRFVDLLVLDVLLAEHAKEFAISLEQDALHDLVARDEELLRTRVEVELETTLELYVAETFGLKLQTWRRIQRLRLARQLYTSYVIRFLALQQDRVEVRTIAHRDPELLEALAKDIRAGADFATLARRHSEDPSSRDGGRLPPFGRGFAHPVAQVAFELDPGQLSAVMAGEPDAAGLVRHHLVYCLRVMPGREVPFEEVREAIRDELETRPLTEFELQAYLLRWRERSVGPTLEKTGRSG